MNAINTPVFTLCGLTVTPDCDRHGRPVRTRKADGLTRLLSRYTFLCNVADETGKAYRVEVMQSGTGNLETQVWGKGGRRVPETQCLHIRQAAKQAYADWYALKAVITLGVGTRWHFDHGHTVTGWTIGASDLDAKRQAHLAPATTPQEAFDQLDKMTRAAAHTATAPGIVTASPRYATPHGLLTISATWFRSGLSVSYSLGHRLVSSEEAAAAVAAITERLNSSRRA